MNNYVRRCKWIAIGCALVFFCCRQTTSTNPTSVIYGGGGVGVNGHVYMVADSLPLDSVMVTLTSFQGTNLQQQYYDISSLSDSAGLFRVVGALGYKVENFTDTTGYVHFCKAIFSKQGYIDTTFMVDNSTMLLDLKIYMRKS
jgi:hypothetical protein